MKKERGFTIVELLIVIVVIGILAAITIVAYNGIQNRAKTQSAQASASAIQKKIESYNAATGSYPTDTSYSAFAATINTQVESAISATGVTLSTPTTSTTGNEKRVKISRCTAPSGATGHRIEYWDFATNAISSSTIDVNTNTTACTTWTALT